MTYITVNIGSGNGLLPDVNKPWLEPMLTWLIKGPLWHSPESSFTSIAHELDP